MDDPRITTRVATGDDVEFIVSLIETTMRSYIEQTWGTFSRELTRESVEQAMGSNSYSIVQCGGAEIGALAVEREPTHIQLAQVYILPSHQNRGVGTRLVRQVADEAEKVGKPLRIRVLAVNPARRLYEREGFVVTSETRERIFMEKA